MNIIMLIGDLDRKRAVRMCISRNVEVAYVRQANEPRPTHSLLAPRFCAHNNQLLVNDTVLKSDAGCFSQTFKVDTNCMAQEAP
jgi:hypothetical protein